MANKTHIQWTDATWNPITGCSIVSPGCTNCYAMTLAGTRQKHHPSRMGLTKKVNGNHIWTGEVRFNEKWLTQPLHWRKPRKIFVCAHGDLFHEDVPDGWIDQIFAVMALCPQHTFQVLTKRPERMRQYMAEMPHRHNIYQGVWGMGAFAIYNRAERCAADLGSKYGGVPFAAELVKAHAKMERGWGSTWPLSNVWLGVSIEDQKHADERIPLLLDTPAAIRFISAEPLLGAVDLTFIRHLECPPAHMPNAHINALSGFDYNGKHIRIDWVIVGGESGPKARPMHPDWARDLRDQCSAANVPFFFKQWGAWQSVLDRDKGDPDYRADYSGFERKGCQILNLEGGTGFHGERVQVMRRATKRSAMLLLDDERLDDVEHNAMPEVR